MCDAPLHAAPSSRFGFPCQFFPKAYIHPEHQLGFSGCFLNEVKRISYLLFPPEKKKKKGEKKTKTNPPHQSNSPTEAQLLFV